MRRGRSRLASFVDVLAGDVVADLPRQELTGALPPGFRQDRHDDLAGEPGEGGGPGPVRGWGTR